MIDIEGDDPSYVEQILGRDRRLARKGRRARPRGTLDRREATQVVGSEATTSKESDTDANAIDR